MEAKRITLPLLLTSKENRAALQRQLLAPYADRGDISLVSFTVNYPGDIKLNDHTRRIFMAGAQGMEGLLAGVPVLHRERRALPTGPEGFWLLRLTPLQAKALTCSLEEEHPLGRLFDLDVLTTGGLPLQRQDVGFSARGCLLCGDTPTLCRREERHSIDEVIRHIHHLVKVWDAHRKGDDAGAYIE